MQYIKQNAETLHALVATVERLQKQVNELSKAPPQQQEAAKINPPPPQRTVFKVEYRL